MRARVLFALDLEQCILSALFSFVTQKERLWNQQIIPLQRGGRS